MTEERAPSQSGARQAAVPFQPRSAYAGFKAFGAGAGAVLVQPEVARELRSAAELATQEQRIAGGLLLGRRRADDQGAYLVIDGFIEAGPGENSGDRFAPGGVDDFTLSDADLRLLRQDAARAYPASLELGWWRTLPALGEFGQRDFATQGALVGPHGVGLLVYGSGAHWGTAYLGPEGQAPDSAGTLVTAPAAVTEPPPGPDRAPERPGPEAFGPEPGGAPVPDTPADVRFVVGALAVTFVVVAIIVGFLAHSLLVTLIIAAIGLLVTFSSLWFQRR